MVWYYCDFCNRNINVKEGSEPYCKSCNVFIFSPSVPPEVRKKRQLERTTTCNNCKRDVYAVPLEAGIHLISRSGEIRKRVIEEPKKKTRLIPDRRFKSGYREEEKGLNCCMCIFFIILLIIFIGLAIMTYGIALLALIPVWLIYRDRQQKKKEMISKINETIDKSLQYLYDLQGKFQYFCKYCYHGINLSGEKSPIIHTDVKEILFCGLCGAKNKSGSLYCIECGNRL